MHDGVAQDIASLGYLVDALASTATTPQQTERIAVLRERITAVVAEIRRSLVNLRTSVGASESLGGAISAIARNLSEVSGVPIHVTLDEQTGRLRPEVEAELFRIAQEAMNNAIKHAQASAIEVHCQVRAPNARITVSDNGRGMQAPRKGSHGLSIMRERALLINASLEMTPAPGGGVAVTVAIEDHAVASPAEDGRTRAQR
jgi:signal transduction histidine kinase